MRPIHTTTVMAGLDPAIHVLIFGTKDVDARDICAKTRFALLPGHDDADRVV
jgi:hypothetical protein